MRTKLPLALLLTVPTVACTTDTSSPPDESPESIATSLEQENGGFDTVDEAPQFGDTALFTSADIEADAPVTDAMATDPTVVDLQGSATAAAHNVIVMWGRMPADPNGAARVWNGSLKLSRGAVVIRRRIAFEPATDKILPRTSRDTISFESKTTTHADGLALTVFDPTPASATPLSLTYSPADGAVGYTLSLGPTAVAGPVVIDAGDGNTIVMSSHRRNDACDHGFLRGRWQAIARDAGRFAGLVVNSDGEPTGHVRGIYGKKQNGDAVFFGKFINRDGQFRGILGGTYDDGHFNGRWLVRSGDHGVVQGMYRAGATLRAGQFLARWAESTCAAADPTPTRP